LIVCGPAIGLAAAEVETGALRGVVRNQDANNEPVEGATIRVAGTDLRATSAADGSYSFTAVPAGNQTLEVSREGLTSTKVPVVVKAGETAEAPIFLTLDQAEVILVFGRPPAGGTVEVLKKQQRSATGGTVMSKDQMTVSAQTTAAGVTKQLPGVTVADNKFVYVRGLGDRYSQTLLNGSYIPSPEPDKRVIPLDLFPANLLDSIVITKTYSPDLPGEFSGGSVQVNTVGVPDKPFVSTGADVKYRHGTTFRDFKTYHGGNLDRFSFDDGTRALPEEVPPERLGSLALPDQDLQTIGRSFQNIWNVDTITAPLDHKLSLSFGEVIGKKGSGLLGVTGALNWGNKYQNLSEVRRIPQPGVSTPFSEFNFETSTREAELSGLLNLTFEANDGQKVGVRTIYTRAGEDEVRQQVGRDGSQESSFPLVSVTRLRYVERSLLAIQPFGEHLLVGDTLLEWRGGYALSQRDEPDNRQVRYLLDPTTDQFFFQSVSGSGRRDFYQLDENIYNADADLSIPFNPLGIPDKNTDVNRKAPEQRIKIGPSFVYRDRDLDARRFLFQPEGGPVDSNGKPIDLYLDPESIFKPENINPNGMVIGEETRDTDSYEAVQSIIAGYGLVDFRLLADLRLQAGARAENSRQVVTTFPNFGPLAGQELDTILENTDILPAGNLIWEFWESKPEPDQAGNKPPPQTMQLRLAGSQTVSRPEFRELAPFEYNDVLGGITAVGNPNLQRAKILNADLTLEWYPSPRDLLSAGVFYKYFDQPIEVVNLPTSGQILTTWDNADTADLLGFEIEGRKNLGMIYQDLQNLSLIANFAYMQSEVRIKKDPTHLQTNDKRPLQGQPEYVLNVGFLYELPSDWTFAVLANTFGDRISAVGATGLDDEKELPRWQLDVSITKRIGKWGIKMTGENLLDDNYEFKQGDITTREFRRGWAIGLGITYSF
jgi:hypothetical protein